MIESEGVHGFSRAFSTGVFLHAFRSFLASASM